MDVSVASTSRNSMEEEGSTDEEDDGPPPPIFEGKNFLLCLPERTASAVVEKVNSTIRSRSGALVDQDGPEVDYIIYKFVQ